MLVRFLSLFCSNWPSTALQSSLLSFNQSLTDRRFMEIDLQRLDNRPVRVDMLFRDHGEVLRGQGCFQHDPSLGDVLGITIADPAGDFELLLQADAWSGEVVDDESGLADFRICLAEAGS
ncbi:hypothetical protein NA78x_001251 [Anatilimnocola sp. NA78]|uniref:hypothetical protein n=1 Tax=Anatilimnocola sp. NA78 TaxID=3415683 RepID=UPI003CE48220